MGKTKVKTFLLSFLLAAVAVCLSVAFAACSGGGGEDKNAGKYGAGEEGIYYYDKDSSTEYLMTLQSGVYMISLDGASGYSGTYSYDDETKSVSFKTSDGETFEATFSDDAFQLEIEGTPYTFLKKVDYTVRFMDGSSVVGTQSVTYGKNASAIDGGKDGYIFLGWYEDAAFTTQYKFNTSVTADTTLYACYIPVDSTTANFEVQFVSGGDVIYTTTTQNGVVYDFPETETLGWWVSATNNEDELTYEYKGEILTESTKLFAVESYTLGASVYGDGLKWNTAVASATITVDGEVVSSTATGMSFAYDFDSLSAGRHDITIAASGATENLVYMTKALSRVSNFSVYGTTLVYNAVENAQYYYVSVTCGNPSHDHTMVYNGNTLTYDFSNCVMGSEGISFTVYACAQGYVESVSETYVYALILDGTTVTIDKATDTASWTAVSGATGYEVYVNLNGEYALAATTTDTEYSLKYHNIGDQIAVSVKPVAPGYWSEESAAAEYTKATLKAPEITGINEYTVSWTKIEGATNYIIYVNGRQVETVSDDVTEYALATDDDFVRADSYVITIKAVNADNVDRNSQESDAVYATDDTMSELLVYEDGIVYWQYAMAAGTYHVTVNGENETAVEGRNSFDVTFTQSGENIIKVWFNTADGQSALAQMSVTAYAVIFDSEGGETVDTIYVAKGDSLSLPVPSYDGDAVFDGWYTLPDLVSGYDSDEYLGDGVRVENGEVFSGNSTLVIYANWLSVKYAVTLDPGMGALADGEDKTVIAKDSATFFLPVPASEDVTYVFYGWYSGENGSGTRYTDENGRSVRAYNIHEDATLYAWWRQVVELTLTTYQGKDVLSAKKGEAYLEVTEMTVPATYVVDGVEYTVAVLDGNAFDSCVYTEVINLPDTILYIPTVNNGYDSGNGAFARDGALKAVNIYPTGDEPDSTKEVVYYSDDGVLFRKNELSGYAELVYFPHGKSVTTYTVPSEVANMYECDAFGNPVTVEVGAILTRTFRYTDVSRVIIPSTVTNVETQAFYYANVEEVIFSGDEGEPLTIGAYAFQHCSALTEVTLPSRLVSFDTGLFADCKAFQNVFVSGEGGNFSSRDGVLCDADGRTIIYCPVGKEDEYVVAEGVTTIGEGAFTDAVYLTDVTIAESVTRICESAFSGCTRINTLTFLGTANSNDLYIETLAFYRCSSIASVNLPANLAGLAAYSFASCTYLTEVTYDARPKATTESLSGLENFAFSTSGSTSANSSVVVLNLGANVPLIEFVAIFGGSKLQAVNIAEGNAVFTSDAGVVFAAEEARIYYFPAGYVGAYVIPGTLTAIESGTFAGCAGLTSVTIPLSVVTISADAFAKCTGLEEVIFVKPEDGKKASDLEVGDGAFSGCTSLKSIELPARLVSLGDGAFSGCTAMEDITVEGGNEKYTSQYGVLYETEGGVPVTLLFCPISNKNESIVIYSSITKIYDSAFADNVNVKEISFDGEVDPDTFDLGEGVFAGCLGLRKMTLPEGLTEIALDSFYECISLSEIIIPETVVTIENAAFAGCTSLETVIIEGTRTMENRLSIESGSGTAKATAGAFHGCTSLKNISLPAYTAIGDYAFYGCTALSSFVVPEGTEELGAYAFYGCAALENVEVPGTVTAVDAYAFSGCSSLKKFGIPSKVTSLGDGVFSETGLTEIELSKNLASITVSTFEDCFSLTKITVEAGSEYFSAIDGVLYGLSGGSETRLWIYPKSNAVTDITVPSTVTSVSAGAFTSSNIVSLVFSDGTNFLYFSDSRPFEGCENLSTVVLPEGMLTLSEYLFYETPVESVTVPSTAVSVGARTFMNCVSLTEVIFADGGTYGLSLSDGASGYGVFYGCIALEEISFPDRTSSLGKYMCYGCTSLESVYIGRDVTAVPSYAFYNCSSLSEIVFAENSSLESLDSYSFYKTGKSEVTIPAAVKTVGMYAFAYSDITAVIFDDSLTSIGDAAFADCPNLSSVVIPKGVTWVSDRAFEECDSLSSVIFENGGDDALTISRYAFSRCDALKSIELPARLTTLQAYVFDGCENLYEITFEGGSTLSSVGDLAFAFSGLKTFSFPETDGTISLGTELFSGCESLEYVYLSSGVKTLGTALSECYSIIKVELAPGNTSFSLDENQPVIYDYEATQIVATYGRLTGTYVIPEGVTTIAAYAFQNQTELCEVVFPSTLATINNYAFDGCSSLETVLFEEGGDVTAGTYVFYNCTALTFIDCGRIVSMQKNIFDGCTSLETIDLSHTTSYGSYIFANCTSLSEVILSDELTALNNHMFEYCTSLKSIDLPDSLTYIGTYTFTGSVIESITIPESVVHIGTMAGSTARTYDQVYTFLDCASLEKIVLPSGLQTMGSHFLEGCTQLCVVTYTNDPGYDENADYSETGYFALPETLTVIGDYAFCGTGIIDVTVPLVGSYGTYIFSGCESLASVKFEGDYTITEGTFQGCTALKDIDLSNISAITKNKIFESCSGLEYIDVSGVATISGQYLFRYCSSLKRVSWNPDILTVPAYTFQDCSSLVTLDGVDTVTRVNNYSFKGCASLYDFDMFASLINLGESAFDSCGFVTLDLTNVTTINSTTTLGYQFQNCTELQSVKYSATVTSLIGFIFAGCTSLRYIEIPSQVTTIARYAFQGCTSLVSIDLSGITSLGTYAFDGCTSLAYVSIESGTTTVSSYAFRNCSSLVGVDIPSSVTSLGSYAFYGCSSLERVTVPAGVTSIGDYCFCECTALEETDLSEGLTSVGNFAFYGCASLKELTLPDSVTSLGTSSFEGCASLESVILGEKLMTIGSRAFAGCVAVERVFVPASVSTVGEGAFSGWTGDQTILVAATEDGASVSWTAGWDDDCGAEVVYGYDS